MALRSWRRRPKISVGQAIMTLAVCLLWYYVPLPHVMRITNAWISEESVRNTDIASRERPFDRSRCRGDMEVNALPPMSEDYTKMIQDLMKYLLRPNRMACRKVMRFGGQDPLFSRIHQRPILDGHKYICADPEFSLLGTNDCLIYSFGISNDWSFDWDMESFGCYVYAFDPSIDTETGSQNGTVMFLKFGIGGENVRNKDGWEIRKLDFFLERLHHSGRRIQYLKMDVEGSEWSTLKQQVAEGKMSTLFRNVEQLGMELHFSRNPTLFEWWYRDVYRIFSNLQELGFYPFFYEPNAGSAHHWNIPGAHETLEWAIEVAWLKTRCIFYPNDFSNET